MSLDRNDPTPLHVQLKADLAARIARGHFPPGVRLPSERELCRGYGVSRTTVREALREMEREGLIRTVPGRATYVATPQIGLRIKVSLGGFTADISREGMTPRSILLEARLIPTPAPDPLKAMGLQPRDEVAMVERLRLVNNVPLALHTVYLNHRLCPDVLQQSLAQASLFELLRGKYGLTLARAEQEVYAVLANRREMELLNLSPPAAVLRAERTTFLDTGEVIEFSLCSYRGDWYRLAMTLEPTE